MDNTSLYQSQLLSAMAQRFYNREFIAPRILTPATVPQLLFQYHTWDSGVTFRVQKTGYGQDGSVNMIDVKASKNAASVEMHGLKAYIDPMEVNQAPEMAVRAAKVRALMNSLKLGLEKSMADNLFSSSVITNGATLTGTDQWSHEDSNPLALILAAQNGKPVLMDRLLVGKQVDDALRQHPLILETVKYTGGALHVTNDAIAKYLGVKEYIVGSSFVDTTVEGQTASPGFIWGKKALLFHRAEGPSNPLMDEVSLGYLPMWGGGGNGAVRVYTGRNSERGTGEGMEVIKAEMAYKPLITSVACGYLFSAAVA